MSIENEIEARCPGCPRACPLSALSCPRGEAWAASLSGEAPQPHHGPEEGPPSRPQPEGECPPPHHHGPEGDFPPPPPHPGDFPPPPPHGPHDAPPPPPPHHGPHGPHGPGPHGPGRGPRGRRHQPPEPEPDRDSLGGLMRRCGHYLVHRSGLPGSRERMLRLLAERGDMDQADLVCLLELRSASVSELLGKLEAQGLVTRRRSEEDRRGLTISLTEAGRAQLPAEPGQDAAFSALTEDERAELKTLLQKLLDSWEAEE